MKRFIELYNFDILKFTLIAFMLSYSFVMWDQNLIQSFNSKSLSITPKLIMLKWVGVVLKNLMAKDNRGTTALYFYESKEKQIEVIDFLPP